MPSVVIGEGLIVLREKMELPPGSVPGGSGVVSKPRWRLCLILAPQA